MKHLLKWFFAPWLRDPISPVNVVHVRVIDTGGVYSEPTPLQCRLGVHSRVLEGGGLMGDLLDCVDCGRSKYPEVFGIAVEKRRWPGIIDRSPTGKRDAWERGGAPSAFA